MLKMRTRCVLQSTSNPGAYCIKSVFDPSAKSQLESKKRKEGDSGWAVISRLNAVQACCTKIQQTLSRSLSKRRCKIYREAI
jgi:hypothetical protein